MKKKKCTLWKKMITRRKRYSTVLHQHSYLFSGKRFAIFFSNNVYSVGAHSHSKLEIVTPQIKMFVTWTWHGHVLSRLWSPAESPSASLSIQVPAAAACYHFFWKNPIIEACLVPLFAFADDFFWLFFSSSLWLADAFAGKGVLIVCLGGWKSSSSSEYDSLS